MTTLAGAVGAMAILVAAKKSPGPGARPCAPARKPPVPAHNLEARRRYARDAGQPLLEVYGREPLLRNNVSRIATFGLFVLGSRCEPRGPNRVSAVPDALPVSAEIPVTRLDAV